MFKLIIRKLAMMALAWSFGVAQATAEVVSVDFTGNDCAGVFTQPGASGFNGCGIWQEEAGQVELFASVLLKAEAGGAIEISNHFDNIVGDDLAIDDSNGSGSWAYAAGPDQGVRFWSAKGGRGFTLFWDIDTSDLVANGGDCDTDNLFSVACLQAANTVTSGEFSTPLNLKNGKHYGLSHLTLYATETHVVPVPPAVVLFLFGIASLWGVARRR